jgi:uncharacterized membrane protein
MPRLDHSIDIKAPKETVFAYVSDIASRPEWVKWTKRAEVTSTVPKGLGATDVMTMQVGPRKEQVEGIVTEYIDGEVFSRRHTRGIEMTDRVAVVSLPDTTKVAWSVEYTPPMGGLGKLIDLLFMVRLFDQLMMDSLTNLKDRLETSR